MIITTYPDGTRELSDHGLTVQVRDHILTAASLKLTEDGPTIAFDVTLGDAQSVGYAWQKQMHQKWSRQLDGVDPIALDHAEWWPDLTTPAHPALTRRRKVS